VKIGDGRVVAPDDVELCAFREFGRASGDDAIGSRPGLAAHAAAQGAPVELGGTQPVKKTRGHAVASEKPVWAGIVQRHHRLRSPSADDVAHPLVDLVQRRVPRDAFELPGPLRSGAAQRMEEALRPVHEITHVAGDLVADDAGRVGRRVRAADLDHSAFIDANREAAGVGQSKVQTLAYSLMAMRTFLSVLTGADHADPRPLRLSRRFQMLARNRLDP